MSLLHDKQVTLASPSGRKFKSSAERLCLINSQPWRWSRDFYFIIPPPRTESCTVNCSMQDRDSTKYRTIILILRPPGLKLPLSLLTPPTPLPIDFLPSEVLSKVRGTFWSRQLSLLCLGLCSVSTVFFLISLFLQCFSSLRQSCMPVTTEHTCVYRTSYSDLWGAEEGEKRGKVWRGA